MMRTDDFDYLLPEELIAQKPLAQRDTCRLLSIDRQVGNIAHLGFCDITSLLKPGDRLIFNDTKVIPARLFGTKENGVPIEFLFTQQITDTSWKVIAKPAKRLKIGSIVLIDNSTSSRLEIEEVLSDGSRVVRLLNDSTFENIDSLLEKYGHFPLPHYITRPDDESDRDAYQTVFAQKKGAIASPTAGLHFTDQLIDKLKRNGVDVSFVTLHVGIGTFRPVKTDDPRNHDIHEEYFELSSKTAQEICATKANGGRIIAVGTTVVRVLEHCACFCSDQLLEQKGKTKIMILPPYEFKLIDGLITNFHLPRSTLLMLVCAFAGHKLILDAYKEAISKKYRFFSYGDAMVIL